MKKLQFLCIVLLLLSVLFSPVQAQQPEEGGTFRYGMTTSPRGMFNPILWTEGYDAHIVEAVFDGLVYTDGNLQIQPMIAESWEFSEDGLALTFYLKEGVKFHDGVELTAHDVAFTFEAICHPHYTGVRFGELRVLEGAEEFNQGEADSVTGITVLDDYTIRFTTTRPHAPILTAFIREILPAHILEDVPIAELEAHRFNIEPIGAGPFVFKEFRANQHVIVEAFADYHGEGPYLDRVIFQYVSMDSVPIYLQQQRVDFVRISPDQYPVVRDFSSIDTYIFETLSYDFLCFNLRQERFADKVVRQAMTYGFQRDLFVDQILEGFGVIANVPMARSSWAFTQEGINTYPYNPDLAQEMLADAGWVAGADGVLEKEGMRLEFELLYTEGRRHTEQMVILFQQDMGDLGIKVNVRPMDFSAAVDRIDARQFDMFTLGWGLGVDPDPYNIWYSTAPWNDPGFVNETSDALIDKGRTETDIERRQEIYADWQKLINDELPYIFLNYSVDIAAINTKVQGIDDDPGPFGPIVRRYLLNNIWIPKDLQ